MPRHLKNLCCLVWLIYCALLLNGCAATTPKPKHVPHVVTHVNQRALLIARQTTFTLRTQLVTLALNAYNRAQKAGYGNKRLLTIIDYSLPSTSKRLWIINLDNNQVLFSEQVAHGVGSGELYATHFSDRINSKETSVGMYVTANQAYRGRHGDSLRLKGLEPGFNDQAFNRAIVLHSATYVSDDFIEEHGYLGQTWGCPAINPHNIVPVINTVKGGTLIFAYGNDRAWLQQSRFLS